MKLYLETERLVVRDLEEGDAASLYEYRTLPAVRAFQSFNPKNVEEALSFIKESTRAFDQENEWFQVGIRQGDRLIGDIGIHFIGPRNLQCEIGYTIDPRHQRKGFATEALTGVVGYLFDRLGKHRIIASLDPKNTASMMLLEKVGFRKEGLFKASILVDGAWEDDLVYAMLRDEWADRKKS